MECPPPESEYETLYALKKGDTKLAATAHARYVLDVRDAFELCNSRIRNLKRFIQGFAEKADAF